MHTELLMPSHTRRVSPRAREGFAALAGLAVVLIVVSHVWFGRASGGVDVLLVLCGFLVGRRLVSAEEGICGSVPATVARLARRSLPMLVVVVAASGVLTLLLQPRTRWETFADQSLATFGFVQNWELARSAGVYASAGEEVSPLQHLWFASVLVQILVAAVLVLWLIDTVVPLRLRRPIGFGVLVGAAIVSFGYAVAIHRTGDTSAYYDTFARAWEPLAGIAAAALFHRLRWPDWCRVGAAGLGVAAIVAVGLSVDGAAHFPGPLTLIPVGAGLLVLGAVYTGRGTGIAPRTAVELLVVIGEMAPAIYLCHWPVLTFWLAWAEKDTVGLLDGVVLLAATVVVAAVTSQFLAPLAAASVPRPRAAVAALTCLVVLLTVAVTSSSVGWRHHTNAIRANGHELLNLSPVDYPGGRALVEGLRVPKLPTRPTPLEAADDLPATIADGCISDFGNASVTTCTYGDQTAIRAIALAGGSHSEHWLAALDKVGRRHGFRVVTYLKMGCPLNTDELPRVSVSNDPYPGCRDWVQSTMASLVADRPDFVFTTTTRPLPDAPGDFVPDSYLGIWDILAANGIGILGIRDTPWMYRDGMLFSPVDCLAEGGDPDACGVPRSDVLADYNPTVDFLGSYPGMAPLDLSDALCRPDRCRAVEGNVLVYHDAHHLSATYVRTLVDELARQLGEATKWW